MTVFYKATRPDGWDFYTGRTINYAAAVGRTVRRPYPKAEPVICTPGVLHASDVPTETLIGGRWPCRLFEVTGTPVAHEGHKHGFKQLRVVREVDAHFALGTQGREVAALIERACVLTATEADGLHAAWRAAWDAAELAAWDAAWYAARDAAWYAARGAAGYAAELAARDAARYAAGSAAWYAARDAARYVATALVSRDLVGDQFTRDHYDTLTRPWRTVIGPIHPDDPPLTEGARR